MRSVSGFPFEVRIAIDFIRLGTGTRLDWQVTFEPGGLLKPTAPLIAAIHRRTFAEDLAHL